ncbi:P-loop containing nucleoside triphosphate hydrolase protein [Pisolithus croceorrhizus]|nr:P-loop containing nucleoside triphosphate hydrolase protein [Pisolithus croceorrhizus]
MADTPLKNLRVFEKLCGENVMSKVILVTTMWDEVDTDVGAERLKELKDNDWRVMISRGSTTFECMDARGSPVELLRQIVQRKKEQDRMGEDEGSGYVPQEPKSSLRMRRSDGIWRDGAAMIGGRAKDIIIALMGPTGAGKSSFIANVTKQEGNGVGHDLTSCTSEIKVTECDIEGFSIVLVDTPGSDHTNTSDLDILKLISDWLNAEYQASQPILSAILYFHRISDNRVAGTPLKNLRVFEKLCGKNAMSKVTLVTTMWDEVDTEVGQERLKELKESYWKGMVSRGSTTFECEDTQGSPMKLLRQIVQRQKEQELAGESEGKVRLQEEISDMKLELQQTAAGQQLCSRLEELEQRRMGALRKVREGTKRADAKTAEDLWREYNEVKNQLDSTLTQARELRMTLVQRFKKSFRSVLSSLKRGRRRTPSTAPRLRVPRPTSPDRATI